MSCLAMLRGTAARRREVMDMDEEPEGTDRIIAGVVMDDVEEERFEGRG